MVKAWVNQRTFQSLAAEELLQHIADGLLNLRRHRMVEIALVGEGRHGRCATKG